LRGQGGGRLGFSDRAPASIALLLVIRQRFRRSQLWPAIDFHDVERVEVYRDRRARFTDATRWAGRSMSSAAQAVLDTGVHAEVVRSVSELDTSLTVNVPIGGTAAVRVGGYYVSQTGGFYKDQVSGKTIDTSRDWGIRGAIGVGIKTDSTATLMVEHSRSEARVHGAGAEPGARSRSLRAHRARRGGPRDDQPDADDRRIHA
jgi:hypothetical protein